MRAAVGMRCAACGGDFTTTPTEARRGRKYCSRLCRTNHERGARNPNYRGAKPARVYVDRFREKNPAKAAAHDAVKNARRAGRLIAGPCETCRASEPATKIHAHHDDYQKPLDVRWFCGPCHRAHHRQAAA